MMLTGCPTARRAIAQAIADTVNHLTVPETKHAIATEWVRSGGAWMSSLAGQITAHVDARGRVVVRTKSPAVEHLTGAVLDGATAALIGSPYEVEGSIELSPLQAVLTF